MNDALRERIAQLPRSPGVYLMKDARGSILYIGKATDLRSRVRSYFAGSDQRAFVPWLDSLLEDIDTIITSSPKEALLLENTLIKKHRPRFNVQLRDDKNYLSLRLDPNHPWPRVEVVRRRRDDGAWYFGPYASAAKVRQTLSLLNRFFQLRTCRDAVLNNRTRPCLQYQIQRCPAPCVNLIDRPSYMDNVDQARLFLKGRAHDLQENLEERMLSAAEALRFEEAARLRDQIRAIEASMAGQHAVVAQDTLEDVVGCYREGAAAAVIVLEFREGALTTVHRYPLTDQVVEDATLIAHFLAQFYLEQGRPAPRHIVVPYLPAESEALEEALSDAAQHRVQIVAPRRGERRKLLHLAEENARSTFRDTLDEERQRHDILQKLQRRLRLPRLPRVIECFDISNFQGDQIVASQVVFVDALPQRDRFRRIRIRSVAGQDDFASLQEALLRRVQRAERKEDPMPDLVVIDGGKGQLQAVRAVLLPRYEGQLRETTVIGLAKARLEKASARSKADDVQHSAERVFLPGVKDPVVLRPHTDERYLLERIRDEAHNTAIRYHRSLRQRSTLHSHLDDIPGVGPKRRQLLLRHFGSLKAIRAADLAALEAVPALPAMIAWSVFDHFHPGEADPPAMHDNTEEPLDDVLDDDALDDAAAWDTDGEVIDALTSHELDASDDAPRRGDGDST